MGGEGARGEGQRLGHRGKGAGGGFGGCVVSGESGWRGWGWLTLPQRGWLEQERGAAPWSLWKALNGGGGGR